MRFLLALRIVRPGVVAVPQGADVLDVAEDAGVHDFEGVGVEHAVVPLVADGSRTLLSFGVLDHLLALA